MSKLSYKDRRTLAEEYFIVNQMTGAEIADAVGVSPQTISKWRQEDKWDDKRKKFLSSPGKVRELLYDQLELVAKGKDASIDADSLAKIYKVISGISDKTSVPVVMSVFKEFDNWMAEQDPELAVEFLDYHKQYIIYKAALEQ